MKIFLRQHWKTLLGCLCIGFMGSTPGFGLMSLYIVLFLAIWLPFALHKIFIKKTLSRRSFATTLGLWLATLVIIYGIHHVYQQQQRNAAALIITAVQQYKQQHGVYPDDIKRIPSISASFVRQYRFYYFYHDGHPFLLYPSSYVAFVKETYRFDEGTWKSED